MNNNKNQKKKKAKEEIRTLVDIKTGKTWGEKRGKKRKSRATNLHTYDAGKIWREKKRQKKVGNKYQGRWRKENKMLKKKCTEIEKRKRKNEK